MDSSLTPVVVERLSNECAMGSDKLLRHGVAEYTSPPLIIHPSINRAAGSQLRLQGGRIAISSHHFIIVTSSLVQFVLV